MRPRSFIKIETQVDTYKLFQRLTHSTLNYRYIIHQSSRFQNAHYPQNRSPTPLNKNSKNQNQIEFKQSISKSFNRNNNNNTKKPFSIDKMHYELDNINEICSNNEHPNRMQSLSPNFIKHQRPFFNIKNRCISKKANRKLLHDSKKSKRPETSSSNELKLQIGQFKTLMSKCLDPLNQQKLQAQNNLLENIVKQNLQNKRVYVPKIWKALKSVRSSKPRKKLNENNNRSMTQNTIVLQFKPFDEVHNQNTKINRRYNRME